MNLEQKIDQLIEQVFLLTGKVEQSQVQKLL